MTDAKLENIVGDLRTRLAAVIINKMICVSMMRSRANDHYRDANMGLECTEHTYRYTGIEAMV